MVGDFPALNIVDCIDFAKTTAACVDSGVEVCAEMKFWFYVPGSTKNLSQSLTFREVWNKTKGGNELHWFWRVGQQVMKDYNGEPWQLDYQQELRRLKVNTEPQVMMDFTTDPDDLERGIGQPLHLTESLFGIFEEVKYDIRRIPDTEKNLWRLLRKFWCPGKLSPPTVIYAFAAEKLLFFMNRLGLES